MDSPQTFFILDAVKGDCLQLFFFFNFKFQVCFFNILRVAWQLLVYGINLVKSVN